MTQKQGGTVVSVSLPTALIEKAKKFAPTEHRAFSGLMREALRAYLTPIDQPTTVELVAIQAGIIDIRDGHFTLYEPSQSVATRSRKTSPKRTRQNPKKRS